MSTRYRFTKKLPWKLIEQLSVIGIKEVSNEIYEENGGLIEDSKCLTDGNNYFWIDIHNGGVQNGTKYGLNNVSRILETLCNVFTCQVISEHNSRRVKSTAVNEKEFWKKLEELKEEQFANRDW